MKNGNGWGNFTPAYLALHRYVRRPGPESDYHMEKPLEYHSNTSELIQMLKKGHYGVELDGEAWDRLITWIDLNVPDHGTWSEHGNIRGNFRQRRIEMRTKYASRPEDPEFILVTDRDPVKFVRPKQVAKKNTSKLTTANWPFDEAAARRMQKTAGEQTRKVIDLGNGVKMNMMLVPAGEFVMGSRKGALDEGQKIARVKKAFWMGELEVTNAQYKQFDARHDSRYIKQQSKDHTTPGYPANLPDQPVVRVSWKRASAFCNWLSERTGLRIRLPSEAEWEYACRAGTETPLHFGGLEDDFSAFANMADVRLRDMAVQIGARGTHLQPIANPTKYDDWIPRSDRFNDGSLLAAAVGSYAPNAWGLHDMHGNVAEWTRSAYRPYPYNVDDGREDADPVSRRVVRGGSWRDRPRRCRSAFRLGYRPWQGVYNVGFRIVCEAEEPGQDARAIAASLPH